MFNLKEKLLQLTCFVDNKYLDKYCYLINIEISLNRTKSKTTHIHHIIPKSYFKFAKKEADNSSDNLVVLSIKNHVLSHYYLCMCCDNKSKLYYSLLCAFNILVYGKLSQTTKYIDMFKSIDLENIEKLNIDRNTLISKKMKGNTYALGNVLSEDVRKKMSKSRTNHPVSVKTRTKLSLNTSNRHWIHKDDNYKLVKETDIKNYIDDG